MKMEICLFVSVACEILFKHTTSYKFKRKVVISIYKRAVFLVVDNEKPVVGIVIHNHNSLRFTIF